MTMTLLPQSPQTSPEVLVLSPGRLWVRSYQGPLSTAPLQVHAAPARLRQAPCDAHLLQSCACDCPPAHCPEGHGRGLEIVPITQSWRGTGSKQGFDHPFHSFGSERHIMSPLKKNGKLRLLPALPQHPCWVLWASETESGQWGRPLLLTRPLACAPPPTAVLVL